ncbi:MULTISPECIES: hypothetical protein [unclassified Rhizobium]|uniref:hypothetical protein n=1 Tax=unclassified Rhizobium TaxID=2613769 RepID=UPI0007EA7A40|nr:MULTISPECIES: hypothetical protein [unclassified Rhizobium]ANL12051.1 hypothetical protein AMJ98_PA00105 [Rhizobium sp. N1341]ANM42896.1 hypothetical protein AMK03_PA00105 [Rhizobium sp. N741]
MPHYFNGLDRNHHAVRNMTAARIAEQMDTAEERLIGCGVPTERRVGALAFWTAPILPEEGQGHAVVVTIRRFEDSPESMVAGDNWRVVSITGKIGFHDPDGERLVINLPYADLKAMRQAGGSCEGYEPYEEEICFDAHGERYRRNGCKRILKDILEINELVDTWEPYFPEEVMDLATAQHAWDGDLRRYPKPVLVHG